MVDASQGVQAQTLANLYKAMELDLTILPVVNKIDLPNIDVDRILRQVEEELGLDPEAALQCSAKLAGFVEIKPVVFSSIYPVDTDLFEDLGMAT